MGRVQEAAARRPVGGIIPGVCATTSPADLCTEDRRITHGLDVSDAQTANRGLPVAKLISPGHASTSHYVVTSIDVHGRLGDRSSLRAMGWTPGQGVAVALAAAAIVVVARADSHDAITRQGHLRLPASVRHACRLNPGDRILLAAKPDSGLLVAFTFATLDHLVLAYHPAESGGVTR